MNMRPLLLVLAIGLPTVAAVAFSRNARTTDRPPGEMLAANDDLSRQLDDLREEVSALRRRPPTQSSPILLSMDKAEPRAAAQALTPEEMKQQEIESVATAARNIESHLARERVDPAWSAKTIQSLREIFRSQVPGTELLDAQCGSTVCKVSVSHGTAESQRQLSGIIATLEPFKTATLYRYHEETQPPRTELYLVREGMSLPTAAAAN